MEKALNVLKELCLVINFNSYWKPRVDEAIAELEEAMKPKTCEGCKFDYDIDNFDSIDGKRLDSFRQNECYMCSRNMQDR